MKVFNRIAITLLCLTSVLILVAWVFYRWWLFGSLVQFNSWHPNFGQMLWGLKTSMIGWWVLSGTILVWLNKNVIREFIQNSLSFVKLGFGDIVTIRMWRLFSGSSLFLGYMILSLIIGEHHPFTSVPMYNYLPKQAYVFFFKTDSSELLPLRQFTTVTGAGVSHKFYNRSNTARHFDENFCGKTENSISRLVFQDVVYDSMRTGNLMLVRSCIDSNHQFGDSVQLLYRQE